MTLTITSPRFQSHLLGIHAGHHTANQHIGIVFPPRGADAFRVQDRRYLRMQSLTIAYVTDGERATGSRRFLQQNVLPLGVVGALDLDDRVASLQSAP